VYEVIISPKAKENLDKLDSFEKEKVTKRLLRLETNPYRFSKRLSGHNILSLKIGRSKYRAIFEIDENREVINIFTIDLRTKAYRNL